jgi:amino acid efflux transporter
MAGLSTLIPIERSVAARIRRPYGYRRGESPTKEEDDVTLPTRSHPARPVAAVPEHRLALPQLAAAAAGPASILAWAALLALSAPVALTFAALGARFPDGGGVASFTARAFGPRTAAVVGWWFYGIVPVGTLAGALIGGDYVVAAVGLDRSWAVVVAIVLLAAAFVTNHGGLRMSGRVQLVLVCGLAALLATAIVAAGPRSSWANFTPFAPHGGLGVVHAAGVLFFAFAGWEAASHLSEEFAEPRRSMPRATALTLLIVGVLYLGLVVTVIGVLGGRAATSPVPLALLLQEGLGDGARVATGVVAVILSFIAINTYVAGGARLGAALARDGALPTPLARGSAAGQVPHRSLGLLAALTALVTAVAVPYGLGLDTLMRATAACLAAVTVVGTAAAVRLLTGRGRTVAAAATVFTGLVLLSCAAYLLVPATLAVGGALAGRRFGRTEERAGG